VIDVVVVTANSKEMVLACLVKLESPSIASITVVDNGSTDGTETTVRKAFPAVEVFRLTEPQGLSAAFNRGAERGSARLVLFLNDDVLATERSIEELEHALEGNAGAVAAAGRLVDPDDGSTQLEYQPKAFPTAATFVASVAGLPRLWPRNPWTGGSLRHPLDDHQTVVVDQPPGACLLVRRDVFEKIGGWDEGYVFWYEDVDLARRLRAHGNVIYVPTAVYEHVGGHSSRRLSRNEVVERSYGGTLRYAGRHFGDWQRRVVGGTFAFTSSIRALMVRRHDPELAKTYRRMGRRAAALARGHEDER
jgi:N-acetylglucosaminyl-diphospho-decaprenol L-rhamnosyltransferase